MTALEVIKEAKENGCQLVRPRKDQPLQYDCKHFAVGGKKKGWIYLDSFTASHVINVYNAVETKYKEKLEKLGLLRLIDLCWKVAK
jgi:hypothetical protein